MRQLIETHLNHCSINSVEAAFEICEKNVYKGDIFSFGCVLYEMMFLKIAFDNNFLSADEEFSVVNESIKISNLYSDDLKNLVSLTMTKNPEDRPNINQVFEQKFIVERANTDLSESYKQQVIKFLNNIN